MGLPTIERPRLLVVEDDPDILEMVTTTLDEEGYDTTPASSLPASLALLDEHVFQLVLTDLFREPGQPPLQSIRPLLAQAAPIPVGVMTAWTLAARDAEQMGLAFLIQKPFELAGLVRAVKAGLQPGVLPAKRQAEIVYQFYAALNDRDWKRVAQLCTPGVKVAPISILGVSPPPLSSGLPVYRAAIERRFLALPGFMVEDIAVFARPVGVAVRFTARWQGRDGIIHYVTGSAHFRFEGDRIAQIEGSF